MVTQPEAKVTVTIAKRLELEADVTAVTACDTTQPMSTAAGGVTINGVQITAPPLPTLPPALGGLVSPRCVADPAVCSVLWSTLYFFSYFHRSLSTTDNETKPQCAVLYEIMFMHARGKDISALRRTRLGFRYW